MPANPVREKRDLLYIFGLPNPTELLVRVAISGEVQVIAQGPNPLDRALVLLQPPDGNNFQPRIYNLLEFAPIAWWRTSTTLINAVENGWLYVDLSTNVVVPQPSQPEPDCCELSIPRPPSPLTGDVLVWNGIEWTTLSPGILGNVITSNGPLTLPSYQPGGGGSMIIGGAVTGGSVGSLLFVGVGPSLAQDGNLLWNDSTNRLGVRVVPTSALDVAGSFGLQVTSVSINTVLNETHHTVLVDASSGVVVITLPTVAGSVRRRYEVKKIDTSSNAVTVDGNGSETIDGQLTWLLPNQNAAVTIVCDGSAWYVI